MPFSAVWSKSTLFAILCSLIRVYTVWNSQLFDQGPHSLPFSVWSMSTLFAFFWQSDQGLHCLPFSAFWSGSALFASLSSLIRVYTICHSQQSDHGLHHLSFSAVWSRNTLFAILSKQYYQGLHCLQFSAVWLVSTLFVILNSLIRVYTVCHSQLYDQGLHYLPFSVWPGSTLFVILSLIRVYTVHLDQQSDRGLQYLPFSAVWSRSRSTLSFSGTDRSGSTLFAILSSFIRAYTIFPFFLSSITCIKLYSVCHFQVSDQGLHFLSFSAVWSGSTLFAILSKQYYQGLHCFIFSAVWSVSTLLLLRSAWIFWEIRNKWFV